jgi:type I restriction enzyme S subunit
MLLSNLNLLATAPGGVARLRELILTLAVQGKLVAQDPKDEPASELLKKIRAEKDRLIAEGRIKRDKPLAEIEEEEMLFGLPVGWEWVRLGDLCSYIQRGKGPVYAEQSEHRVISQKCVRWYGLNLEPARFVTAESLTKYEAIRFLQAGDLLWNSTGTGTIGRACLVPTAQDRAGLVADSHVTVVRPVQFNGWFLWRWIQSPYVQNEIEGSASGTTNQIELNTSTVLNHLVPVPPLVEQSRIVTRVEELMRLCDALEAKGQLEATQHAQLVSTLLATLTESETPEQLTDNWHRIATHFDLLLDRPGAVDALEKTILQLAVHGLLVPQDPQDEPASELLKKIRAEKDKLIAEGKIKRDKPLTPIAEEEQPFMLPLGWEWVSIETLADVGTGTTPSRDNSAFFAGGSIPWVTSGETGKQFIASTAQHVTELALLQTNLTIYPVGTLIVAMYGQGKTRGQVSELQIEATTNQACAAIVLIESSAAHRCFVKLVFEKSYDEIRELSAGGAQPNLNVGKIKSTAIPLPPLAEQSRIVTRVAQLRRLCADLRQRLSASQSTQAHLAEALVSG